MSVIAAACFGDAVLVASDTYCRRDDGPSRWAKLYPVAHVPAILAGRGPARLIARVAMECSLLGWGFDELAERLPGIIAGVVACAPDSLKRDPKWGGRGAELVLGGLSTAGSGVLHVYLQKPIGDFIPRFAPD